MREPDWSALERLQQRLTGHGTTAPPKLRAVPPTVAREAGCLVARLPGPATRRIADLHPGEAKTDARDAAVIPDAARAMPHTLRSRRGLVALIRPKAPAHGHPADRRRLRRARRTDRRPSGHRHRLPHRRPPRPLRRPCPDDRQSGTSIHGEHAPRDPEAASGKLSLSLRTTESASLRSAFRSARV